jgi:hypothetical protein
MNCDERLMRQSLPCKGAMKRHRTAGITFGPATALRVLLVALDIGTGALGVGVAVAPASAAGPPYKNCSEAHADGRYNIPQDDPAYSSKLDRDGDGIACEPKRR